LAYEHQLQTTQDKIKVLDLLTQVQTRCQQVLELDLNKEYEPKVKDLLTMFAVSSQREPKLLKGREAYEQACLRKHAGRPIAGITADVFLARVSELGRETGNVGINDDHPTFLH